MACHLPFGLAAGISNCMPALLWIKFTLMGFRMIKKKNIEMHRRWMIRSFALTMSIIINRILLIPTVMLAISIEIPDALIQVSIAGVVTWLSWTTPLLLAEWHLERNYYYTRKQ